MTMHSILKKLANHHQTFLRFCLVGAVNTAIDFGVFVLLVYRWDWGIVIAHILSFTVATINSYVMNRQWSFHDRQRQSHRVQLPRFLAVTVSGLALSTGAIHVLGAHMPAYAAKILVIGITLFWNYAGSSLFVFRASGDTHRK
jgi:putative flippase GtrA